MSWKAENVRTVLFPSGEPKEVLELWASLGVGDPDQFQKRTSATGSGQASGSNVLLTVQAGRVELRMQNVDADEGPQLIDDPVAALKQAHALTIKLLEKLIVTRLACCADLVEQLNSVEEAKQHIAKCLPGISLPAGARDLIFQMNVRRKFRSDDVDMNRLCKWGTATQQLMHVEISANGAQVPVILQQRDVATLGLDVNSAPQATAIPKEIAKRLLGELHDETAKLMTDGFKVLQS